MANVLKRSTGEASTTGSTIYTVPVGGTATIIGCRASNKTTTPTRVHFTLNGVFISGAGIYLPESSAIDILVGGKIVAEAGDALVAFADDNSTVDVYVSYLEQS